MTDEETIEDALNLLDSAYDTISYSDAKKAKDAKAALVRLVAEKERAERERDNWKAHAISRGKRLRQARNKFINICDEIEDEGDRVYFGSSNHADQFKEEVAWLDDFTWDKIMGEPDDWDLLGALEKQKDHNAALTARLRSVCEALEPFAKEGGQWDRGNDGDFPLIKSDEYGVEAVEAEFTVGDLRRARAVLDAAKKEMGG